jgi:hypothetical protein
VKRVKLGVGAADRLVLQQLVDRLYLPLALLVDRALLS